LVLPSKNACTLNQTYKDYLAEQRNYIKKCLARTRNQALLRCQLDI
jgi:hypothetical protein